MFKSPIFQSKFLKNKEACSKKVSIEQSKAWVVKTNKIIWSLHDKFEIRYLEGHDEKWGTWKIDSVTIRNYQWFIELNRMFV